MDSPTPNILHQAITKALGVHKQFPDAFPSLSNLDPSNFERWSLKTPERWVDPKTLETDEMGRVKVGGDTIMIWRYFTAIWTAATASDASST
jgi:hypothetical protein